MDVTSQSLLQRLQSGASDDGTWQRLVDLYRPLILHWLRRTLTQSQDTEDLTQEILLVIVREVSGFVHPGHAGAFRGWLKAITVNRMRRFWRSRMKNARATGSSGVLGLAAQLEDPDSDVSRLWDEEHDQFVLRRLLELMESEFEPQTLQAFRRTALEEEPAKIVAGDLQMTVNAVYVARSTVMRRLRLEAQGLID